VKAQLELSEKGTFEVLERGIKALAAKPMSEDMRSHYKSAFVQTLILQRKFAEALREAEGMNDEALARDPEGLLSKYEVIGVAKKMLHDEAGAREAFLKSKGYLEKYVSLAPDDPKRHSRLAQVLAWLGEKEAAIAEAKRATELLPESVDAFDGPMATQSLAEVYVIVGEYDKALDLADGLLSRPSGLTLALLKINPILDPVRQHPRYLALLKKYGG
jgi:tetratricopeptide (TPR) repeat protein